MKKQIITVVSFALVAVLLFVTYIVFLKDDGIEEVADPFYVLTPEAAHALDNLDEDATLYLRGYDSADDYWTIIYRFAKAMKKEGNVDVETDPESSFKGVEIEYDGRDIKIEFDSFFKTLYDGTRYAFDGESLLVNGILSLAGKDTIEFKLRALSGYDTDGHQVTSQGNPFMFPSIERSQIEYLTINNEHGKYSIYQYEEKFYFDSSQAVAYDEEMFAQLTTNCRYVVTQGKMKLPEDRKWADYGLDIENPATANYSILTTTDENGNYFMHSVYIGSLASSGTHYYSRYVGGLYKNEGDEKDGTLLHNLTNDFIYLMPVSAVDASIALPQTDMMKPTIMTAITDTNALFSIQDIRIDFYEEGINAVAKNMRDFNPAPNLSVIDQSSITKIILDKKNADEYSSYSDGWQNHLEVFAGFTSSDGKATYLEAAIAKTAPEGNYSFEFGLVRDEANGAYLPAKVTVDISYDGINWHEKEYVTVHPEQDDKSVKKYTASFTDEKTVKYIRFGFDVPQKAKTYVVFDEIRIYADGDDAQPTSAIGGTWKLISPTQYLSEGRNFAYLDMTNFNDFVQSVAALEGEKVVACGFSDNGNAVETLLKKDILEKYGLANPARHYGYTYDGVVCDVYVSAPNEEGKYYAYSTYSGDVEGKHMVATTDVIVELSTETAKWLSWDFVEFLDHSLLSMYLVDITEMEITFDGKEYAFDLGVASDGTLGEVVHNGKKYEDLQSFKFLYQTILSIQMHDEYVPSEGSDEPTEYLRIKIHSESSSPEFVFYRVSATRCYFTVDGEGSYYALVEDVDDVREDVLTFVSGGTVERR